MEHKKNVAIPLLFWSLTHREAAQEPLNKQINSHLMLFYFDIVCLLYSFIWFNFFFVFVRSAFLFDFDFVLFFRIFWINNENEWDIIVTLLWPKHSKCVCERFFSVLSWWLISHFRLDYFMSVCASIMLTQLKFGTYSGNWLISP